MKFHPYLFFSLTSFLTKNRLKKNTRFPLVLMLEPTHQCNLTCTGCGKIREFKDSRSQMMSLEDCLLAVDESNAPIVSITGGEPLIYPELDKLIDQIIKRKRHIYLCTNGILLKKFMKKIKPSPYLNINVSLDGMKKTHDKIRNLKGVFGKAIDAIKEAKEKGFRVVINTTIYSKTKNDEIIELFSLLSSLKVNGVLLSPGFDYFENDHFLTREEAVEKFKDLAKDVKKYPIMNTPLYIDFLKGERSFTCTPWGNPNRNVFGWKSPCYLITDRYYNTFDEMMKETQWHKYGTGNDPRCRNCMMHSGYEPTIVSEAGKSKRDILRMLKWNFS
ncbi:adenosyl-hopene transferase HpnH [Candidatus Auribacterota bacterium]